MKYGSWSLLVLAAIMLAGVLPTPVVARQSDTVAPAGLLQIKVSPANPTVNVGSAQAFTAIGRFKNGSIQPIANTAVTWSSSVQTVAQVTKTGLATTAAVGQTVIAASVGGLRAATLLTSAEPIGSATGVEVPCEPGGLVGRCYDVTVSCPAVATVTPEVKVISPAQPALGTVIFGVGGGGIGFYDEVFTYGATVVSSVVNAGFTAAMVSFQGTPDGWLTGPGGPRKLACRYATTAQWIYDNIHVGNSAKPMCATGNSGGSAAIVYALSHYGMGDILSMVEPTSGPPLSRIDHGCICDYPPAPTPCQGNLPECYTAAAAIINAAYGSRICSQAQVTESPLDASLFLNDSILSPDAVLAYPKTDVHVLFGGKDNSSAVPQGYDWATQVTTKMSIACVADATHEMPDTLDAALQIASDLTGYCKLQ